MRGTFLTQAILGFVVVAGSFAFQEVLIVNVINIMTGLLCGGAWLLAAKRSFLSRIREE